MRGVLASAPVRLYRTGTHYGNDEAYADELARYAVDIWCREVAGRPNAHGGVFQPGVFSVSSNVSFGKGQGATPDGRKAGEPLADGISPVHTPLGSHDVKGITAVINSAAGYSTLWCELDDSLKRDIISRTELSFDDNSDLTPPG